MLTVFSIVPLEYVLILLGFLVLPSLPFVPVQFSTSVSPTAPMEAPLQAQYGAPLEPLGFGLSHPCHMDEESSLSLSSEHDYLQRPLFSPNETSTTQSEGSITTLDSSSCAPEEEESLVDSQPMCFKENPFLVANRKSKGLPPGQKILSGPPVGYGKEGQLQPWLYNKARCLPVWFGPACCVKYQRFLTCTLLTGLYLLIMYIIQIS